MSRSFRCPKCGSENIQSCPVIYQSGTVGHSYTSRSGDYQIDTSGTESTHLAQSVAPPAQKETFWGFMLITGAIAAFALYDGFHYVIAGIFGLVAAVSFVTNQEASEYNEKIWPREYKNWQRSYMCHRCGNIFIMH